MTIADCPDVLTDCITNPIGDVVSGVAGSAWDKLCKSFADSAVYLLKQFADAFVAFPKPDVNSITGPYAISMWIAGIIAVILVIGQVIRTAATHDGSPMAQAFIGLGKAVLVIMVLRFVGDAALTASNEIAHGIINASVGGDEALKAKLSGLFQFATATSGAPGAPMSLWLVVALVGIALTVVLWFEMLLANAAVLVMIATAPIAAVGQVSESTKAWWTKLCAAVVQLITLKPLIALIFAIGFGVLGKGDVTGKDALVTTLSGLLILLLAVFAWPVIAKFMTFTSVSFASGGLAGALGFVAGRASSGSGPVGVNPGQFAQASEARTMAGSGANAMAATEGMGMSAGGGATAAAGSGAATGALGAVALPLAAAKVGLDVAQRGLNALTGQMSQMASHAGVDGAHQYSKPAGHSSYHGPWTSVGGGGSSQAAPPVEQDRAGTVAAATPPAQGGQMPETRAAIPPPADPPPAVVAHQLPTPTSPIEEVRK